MTALSVNVNKIALLRNSRGSDYPSVSAFSELAIDNGARGITVHPRPDLRHITPDDVGTLSDLCQNHSSVEFNIEGNPFAKANSHYPGLLALIEKHRPDQATLVPDSEQQLTSDHGFDLVKQNNDSLKTIISAIKDLGVRVSLFMDPDLQQIDRAKAIGADRIELYTGPYAAHFKQPDNAAIIAQYQAAIEHAHAQGLGVNAGHDLDLENLSSLLSLGPIKEVSIGHALTVEALTIGYGQVVKQYHNICERYPT